MPFSAVSPTLDLAALETRVQRRWDQLGVMQASFERNREGPLFSFYDGPPTANGRPGVHHVAARVFKDVFPRYRTMKGYHVPRRAGWDCHGIPVELEVERDLGFRSKKDIERFGVEEFNVRCRESVGRYVDEWQALTRRIGYWVDTDDAYWTMSGAYIDSVWWSLKTLHQRGLMYEDYRVTPYCPRCGTSLSDHEVAQGYRDVEDTSVFVRLPLLSGPLAASGEERGADLLVWTTMPWTFMATTAAVIGPGLDYVLAEGGRAGDRPVVVARDLVHQALGDGAHVIRALSHSELIGCRYRGPFDYVGPGSRADPGGDPGSWRIVVTGDFVTLEQGSGIVSTGAAFGAEDMAVARENALPIVNPVTTEGRFDAACGPFAGMGVREADPIIVEALDQAGLLLHAHPYRHSYPFCWRCDTALIYYAKPSWYLATIRHKAAMLADNDSAVWQPEHIKAGRYGDWLANNVDWALSRERYWGTPLPLWRCQSCRHVTAVGSRAELAELSGCSADEIDRHRPGVDGIVLPCTECGGDSRRVLDVIDAWYDSGAMPFAQFGYPHIAGSVEALDATLPANFICEGIDQTRGWFYSLQAVSTLLFGHSAYRRALCLGHIVDEDGRKMSKSAHNAVDPWALIDAHGADMLRWLMVTEGNPWQPRAISDTALTESFRGALLTLWNVYYFFVAYARAADWRPEPGLRPTSGILDRYILAELRQLVKDVDAAYDQFDATLAGRRIASFLDTLSNWYLRRSRSRFSRSIETDSSTRDAAFHTLWTALGTLARLLAPITPFLADELYGNLVLSADPDAAVSVHLADFPVATGEIDHELIEAMSEARRLVSLGRNARQRAGIGVRQPLRRAAVVMPRARRQHFDTIAPLIAAELNVWHCELVRPDHPSLIHTVKPNFRALGKRFGKHTSTVADLLNTLDAKDLTDQLNDAGVIRLTVPGLDGPAEVDAQMVELVEQPADGWTQSSESGYAVALDLSMDDELRQAGTARELVRAINDLRRQARLDLSDEITLDVQLLRDPRGVLKAALDTHLDTILAEVQGTPARLEPDRPESVSSTVDIGDALAQLVLRRTAASNAPLSEPQRS